MVIHDKIDLNELFGDDDNKPVDAGAGPEVVRRPTRSTPKQAATDTGTEAQQMSLQALQVVLTELREHLTRTLAWVDEVMAGIDSINTSD